MDTSNMKQDKFYVHRVLSGMIYVKCSKCGKLISLRNSDVEQAGENVYMTEKEVSCSSCNESIPKGMLITAANSDNEQNTVAIVLQVYAIINAICGLILAFLVGDYYYGGIGFLLFCSVLVASGLIYAFGEVIKLLHEIKLNTRKAANKK